MNPRVILITGANSGLGLAIARAFLEESIDNLLWLGVHSADKKAQALIQSEPTRCRVITLDVTQREDWSKAVNQILAEGRRIDVLVNNAGIHEDGFLATLPLPAWDRVLSVNLDGVFHGCQGVLPTMISQRSGRIVNVASLSALLPPAGQGNYAAAKAGVLALTQALAKEVARIGITINAVCPGYIQTEALSSMSPEQKELAQATIPMRRFGRPEEVAAAVRFLACADATYITGSFLKVDGGIF